MAEYKFSAAINPADFPYTTRSQPRTVIIPGLDNRLRAANGGVRDSEADNNPQNFPQIMYAENIMPSKEGVFSISYAQLQDEVAAATEFDEVFILRNDTEDTWFFSPALGLNYVTDAFGSAWASTDPLGGAPVGNEVSIAYVNGVTYVCYANLALLEWDGTNFNDVSASLTGVVIADVKAICGSVNYLCLLTEDLSFKWSSLVDPLDFVPSSSTGAGSQIPADIRGTTICLTSVSGGVIIHCAQNAVAALATNNSAQPWTFREIKNAGGISSRKQVSTDNNSGATYIYGTNGFQQVGLREAEIQFPSVTDFLSGQIMEIFDPNDNTLAFYKLATPLYVKIGYVAGRYVIISYGETTDVYSYALIFDTSLRRWGKIAHDHKDCFSSYGDPRQSICLLEENGVVSQVQLYASDVSGLGVLIMGRYQLNRTSQVCSQEVELEVLDADDSPVVFVAPNWDGVTAQPAVEMLLYENDDRYRKYQWQTEGENLTYIVRGKFSLATMLVTVTRGAAF